MEETALLLNSLLMRQGWKETQVPTTLLKLKFLEGSHANLRVLSMSTLTSSLPERMERVGESGANSVDLEK